VVAASYTAVLRPDGAGGWVVALDEESRVHATAKTLHTARVAIRNAAALWAHVEPDDLDLAEAICLPGDVQTTVDDARNQRHQAESARITAHRATRLAAHRLVRDSHLSVRDAGEVLGISFSRVAQLLKEKEP
jgi:predicted RNase H-like HicB family nuclease